jgi:anti-anti-sigma factor
MSVEFRKLSGSLLEVQIMRDDSVVTISPAGELELATLDVLTPAVEEALATPELSLVILDLGSLSFMDSTAVGWLAHLCSDSRDSRLRFSNPSEAAQRMLDLCGLSKQLPYLDDGDQTSDYTTV